MMFWEINDQQYDVLGDNWLTLELRLRYPVTVGKIIT